MNLKSGDTVRVVGSRGTAKVRAILTSMHGALLEKQIDGFRRLNQDENQARAGVENQDGGKHEAACRHRCTNFVTEILKIPFASPNVNGTDCLALSTISTLMLVGKSFCVPRF